MGLSHETVVAALRDLMSDISEATWRAQWTMGLEFSLWARLVGDEDAEYGMSSLRDDEAKRLRELSEDAGGWIFWDKNDGEKFIVKSEWLKLYEAHKAGHVDL